MRRLAGAFVAAALHAFGAQAISVLIITGNSDEPNHHWRETTASIRETLEQTGRFEVRVTEEPRGITAESLRGYDVAILNYNGPRFPAAAEKAIEDFVGTGKGLVAFHMASYGPFFGMAFENGKWRAGDDGWKAFPRMIGARWAPENIGHAHRGVFDVEWRADNPIGRGAASFQANDELYHKMTLAPGARVVADAMSRVEAGGTGRREPMMWTNQFGSGRVFFTTLGHDAEAWFQPGMRGAFARGVEWAATGNVSTPTIDTGPKPIRLLAVTGGHGYPVSFYAMLDSLPGVSWSHATSQAEVSARKLADEYDVVLLHDMHDVTSDAMRARLKAFVEAGKGVVSVHHAVVDYTDWPYWYEQVTGVKYFVQAQPGHAASHYREGVDILATAVNGKQNHPVLRDVPPLLAHDEAYRGMWHAPGIEALMETQHPENDRPVVFVGPHPRARVVTIQLGHSDRTMRQPAYRRLMSNAVAWAARKTN